MSCNNDDELAASNHALAEAIITAFTEYHEVKGATMSFTVLPDLIAAMNNLADAIRGQKSEQ